MSSDPKPREGTETLRRRIRDLFPRIGRQTQNPERGRKLDCANWLGADPGGRQTQNPERGRKLHIDFLDLARREDHVVRPKTPREDGNSSTIASMSMSQSSSRQTQNPERGRKQVRVRQVRVDQVRSSDPKPREGSRQTQNPERGRKLVRHLCLIQVQCPVVRPKTPRGDGNILSANSSTVPLSGRQTQNPERESSDPKPREGTETPRGWRMRCARKCRQTQNPERGRKLDAESHRVREVQQSSDPKPREGTETRGADQRPPHPVSRQTQNPERGRKRISPATPQPRYCSMSSDPKPREGTETLNNAQ
ncbi:Uncharacterised protein [Mycobacterium tuberculosis]|nr:Uncharacterised protein [Mycobacterium tuberculosis]